jgi:gamma-glutamylcyclotransferase (GGCT)/AIG2-like uncharacterized protein YtfP
MKIFHLDQVQEEQRMDACSWETTFPRGYYQPSILKENMMNLFVYRTLKKSLIKNLVLSGAQFLGFGFTTDHPYDLGYYPATRSENGSVYGDLYEIDSNKLDELDRIKGYYPKYAQYSLYVRKEIKCIILDDSSRIDAFAYFYNQSLNSSRIIRGDLNDIYHRIFLKSSKIRPLV